MEERGRAICFHLRILSPRGRAHSLYRPQDWLRSANFLIKLIHNAIEDEYIERSLERDFPGARGMLTRAYLEGIKAVLETDPSLKQRRG